MPSFSYFYKIKFLQRPLNFRKNRDTFFVFASTVCSVSFPSSFVSARELQSARAPWEYRTLDSGDIIGSFYHVCLAENSSQKKIKTTVFRFLRKPVCHAIIKTGKHPDKSLVHFFVCNFYCSRIPFHLPAEHLLQMEQFGKYGISLLSKTLPDSNSGLFCENRACETGGIYF